MRNEWLHLGSLGEDEKMQRKKGKNDERSPLSFLSCLVTFSKERSIHSLLLFTKLRTISY